MSKADPQQPIELSGTALRASITPYGGYLARLRVGNGRDVVLGHADGLGRRADESSLGCLIGRHAGRIRSGMFHLDGWNHQLTCNGVGAHLHGGFTGFGACVWDVLDAAADHLVLGLTSPDGHENYPGELSVRAEFRIIEGNRLRLTFEATTTRNTLCSLTWHPYFNLAGHFGGHVGEHLVSLDADHYLPLAGDHCPTGDVLPVDGTPFDLRDLKRLGPGMVSSHPQIGLVHGYDHYFVLPGEGLRRAARVLSPDARVSMEVWTTQPGITFYTANGLDLRARGKQDERYGRFEAFCLEPHGFPDADNHPSFPSNVLRPGETYREIIEYRFETHGRGEADSAA